MDSEVGTWVGLVGAAVGIAALCLSIFNTIRASRLERLQVKLSERQLAKDDEERQLAKSAQIDVRLIRASKTQWVLKVWNKGPAPAHNVQIFAPPNGAFVAQSTIDLKFPMEVMRPHQSVDLTASPPLKPPFKATLRATWALETGETQHSEIIITV
ncbi:MAG: hypothetical protein LAT81_08795 [Oceanicaulis sp.]|nr:hypothetical protein [Oceanicaulis sp.]